MGSTMWEALWSVSSTARQNKHKARSFEGLPVSTMALAEFLSQQLWWPPSHKCGNRHPERFSGQPKATQPASGRAGI